MTEIDIILRIVTAIATYAEDEGPHVTALLAALKSDDPAALENLMTDVEARADQLGKA